nr:glycoside hydrolase family 3 protein [Lachnospiraceae bacterium]
MKKTILIIVSALIIVLMGLFFALFKVSNKGMPKPLKNETTGEINDISGSVIALEHEPEPESEPKQEPKQEPVPEPEPEPTKEELLNIRAQEILGTMTLNEKIYQLFFVTPKLLTGEENVTELSDLMKETLDKKPVGGIVLFKENIISKEQVKNLNNDIAQNAKFGILISVDEEGGSVARLGNANIGFLSLPHMAEIGAEGDVSKAYEVGDSLAKNLKELNFNMDFAPVADILTNPENTVVKKRSFGSDANLV